MSKGLASFIVRFLSTKNRDLFIVRLGSALILSNFGIVGVAASLAAPLLRRFLGVLIEDGTFVIDLGLDSLREGAKLKEFEKTAAEAYKKATAKVYDEEKKKAIRQEYLDIISKIGGVGDGPK